MSLECYGSIWAKRKAYMICWIKSSFNRLCFIDFYPLNHYAGTRVTSHSTVVICFSSAKRNLQETNWYCWVQHLFKQFLYFMGYILFICSLQNTQYVYVVMKHIKIFYLFFYIASLSINMGIFVFHMRPKAKAHPQCSNRVTLITVINWSRCNSHTALVKWTAGIYGKYILSLFLFVNNRKWYKISSFWDPYSKVFFCICERTI